MIFGVAERYQGSRRRALIFDAGSTAAGLASRDWAAKGTRLLGVRAAIARI